MISALNGFAHYLSIKGFIEEQSHYSTSRYNSAQLLSTPIVTEQQHKDIITTLSKDDLVQSRNRAIFSLAYYAGLTSTELANIKYQDFERYSDIDNSVDYVTLFSELSIRDSDKAGNNIIGMLYKIKTIKVPMLKLAK